MDSKKTLLMTGASGLVGSRFVDIYNSTYDIVNIDLTTGVDITNLDSLTAFVQAHPAVALIHLAAFTNTAEAFKQDGDESGICYKVNVLGTHNVAEVCKKFGIHLIHVSTDFVFDGQKESPYVEDDARTPIEWYGKTKALAEEEVEKSGADYTIVRIAYPYRAKFDAKPDIIKKIRMGLDSGSLHPQFADTIITPTFIDDIARGFAAIVTTRRPGIFHFTGSTSLSPYDLACKVAKAYNHDVNMVEKGSLQDYLKANPRPFARYAGMDNTKAKTELGLDFADIDTGLKEVIAQESDAS